MADAIKPDYVAMRGEQHRAAFEAFADDFFRRWQPADRNEAARFHAELFTLVRQIYIDAQAPLMAQVAAAMALAPPIFRAVADPKPTSATPAGPRTPAG